MINVCSIKHSPWFDSQQNTGNQENTLNSEMKLNLVYCCLKISQGTLESSIIWVIIIKISAYYGTFFLFSILNTFSAQQEIFVQDTTPESDLYLLSPFRFTLLYYIFNPFKKLGYLWLYYTIPRVFYWKCHSAISTGIFLCLSHLCALLFLAGRRLQG